MTNGEGLSYTERLRTFQDQWDESLTAARQLAALGHVCDRPPVEALEEGSRCVSCGAFVKKDRSLKALGDESSTSSYEDNFDGFKFHHPSCTRLQVRVPLEPQSLFPGLHGGRIRDLKSRWERRSGNHRPAASAEKSLQSSSFFTLPTELRLEIYGMVLPVLEPVTEIVTLNRDSARVITSAGYQKSGPLDTTKPNLLMSCRAVHEEALDLLYARPVFRFTSTKVLFLFLRSIGKSGRRLVKSIDIECGDREDAIAFALLGSCQNLRSITIRLPRPVIVLNRAPLWMVEGMSCLLALSGLEEVRFGAYRSLPNCMSDGKPDAAVIRTQLTRPLGSPTNFELPYNGLEVPLSSSVP